MDGHHLLRQIQDPAYRPTRPPTPEIQGKLGCLEPLQHRWDNTGTTSKTAVLLSQANWPRRVAHLSPVFGRVERSGDSNNPCWAEPVVGSQLLAGDAVTVPIQRLLGILVHAFAYLRVVHAVRYRPALRNSINGEGPLESAGQLHSVFLATNRDAVSVLHNEDCADIWLLPVVGRALARGAPLPPEVPGLCPTCRSLLDRFALLQRKVFKPTVVNIFHAH